MYEKKDKIKKKLKYGGSDDFDDSEKGDNYRSADMKKKEGFKDQYGNHILTDNQLQMREY